MKKIFCLMLMLVFAAGLLTGCIDFEAIIKNEKFDSDGFIIGELSEKYGGTFEVIGHEGSLTAFSSVDFVRCIENGIEFKTHIEKHDGVWEMSNDSYPYALYVDNLQKDTEDYLNTYLTDYKILPYDTEPSRQKSTDFSLPAPADYEEYKQLYQPTLDCKVYLPAGRKLTDEEFSALQENCGANDEDGGKGSSVWYREPINLNIHFYFYTVPDELMEKYDFYLPEHDSELYDYRNTEKIKGLNYSYDIKSGTIIQE